MHSVYSSCFVALESVGSPTGLLVCFSLNSDLRCWSFLRNIGNTLGK